MAFAGYRAWARSDTGAVIPNADIEVRLRDDDGESGILATIYEDPQGVTEIDQTTWLAGADGSFEFFADSGQYNVIVGAGVSAEVQPVDLFSTSSYAVTDGKMLPFAGQQSDLLADTVFSYTEGSGKYTVATGDLVQVAGGGFYEVAASAASDEHYTTAGGVKLYEAGPAFSTRARLLEWKARLDAAGASAPNGYVVFGGNEMYEFDDSATLIPDAAGLKPFGRWYFNHWGDNSTPGTTDMHSACQAAIDYAKVNGGTLWMREERYMLSDELDCYYDSSSNSQVFWGIRGIDRRTSEWDWNFTDPSKAVLNFRGGENFRQNWYHLRDFGFAFSNQSTDPLLIDFGDSGSTYVENIYSAKTQNTQIRADAGSNDRWYNIMMFGGGYKFEYLDSTGVTVDGTSGTNTLTVTGYTPQASDVGKIVTIEGSGTTAKYEITAAGGGAWTTQEALVSNYTGGVPILIPQLSGTSGGTTATADADCFNSEIIGMKLWVADIGGNLYSGTVTAVPAANQVTFDVAFPATFSQQDFGTAVFELNGSVEEHNDIIAKDLHIEDYDGIAYVWRNVTKGRIPDFKAHGYSSSDTERLSVAAIWSENNELVANGLFEADARGGERMRIMDQGSRFMRIGDIQCARKRNEVVFRCGTWASEGGVVVGNVAFTGGASKRGDFFVDPNSTPRLEFMGVIEASAEENEVVAFLPSTVRVGRDSGRSLVEDVDVSLVEVADAITGGNVATIGVKEGRQIRNGDVVTVTLSLRNIDTTGMTGANQVYIRGLSFAATGLSAGSVVGDGISYPGSATQINSRIGSGDSYVQIVGSGSGIADAPLTVAGIASGTGDIQALQITYRSTE